MAHGVREQLAGPGKEGVEGTFIRATPSPPASSDAGGAAAAARNARVTFALPSGPGTGGDGESM